ncbi:heme uptake protein IsdC [Paenibacillus sp. P96]|uniref:Heme uptake protein IsdC n=2 Tax=Paenibacillus zeirhizosphaerae TaxID=2987519 RepID=A0ABT9FR16_9BACL|nr:heme uptake protein IsdC [Paenibacillus sp. P96]MDP4097173.1 heme uptake protein IsdC [Paenibacillus sp. P96]
MRRWKGISILFFAAVLSLSLCISPQVQAEATALQDGEYTMDYNILKAEDDSVSMANDYFEKPAVIHVNNGKIEAEIQLNHSGWITEFKVPAGGGYVDAATVSSDSAADTRVARFPVQSLDSPLMSKIHVTVPSVDYDHDYTIRFAFDSSSMTPVKNDQPAVSPTEASEASSVQAENSTVVEVSNDQAEQNQENVKEDNSSDNVLRNSSPNEVVSNPHTADTAPIAVWMTIFVVSLLFLVRRVFLSKAK